VIEVFGYLASAVIILSLTMSSVVKLRLVGLVGATMFGIYGALVGSIPVVVTNVVIIGLHSYFLTKAYRDEEYFTLLEVQPDSPYLLQFLEFHADDIRRIHPDFTYQPVGEHLVVFVLRDMVPAGVFIGRRGGEEGVMDVELDFVIPQYRDLRPAAFLFGSSREAFAEWGVTRLAVTATTGTLRSYLVKVGFVAVADDRYELDLTRAPALRGRGGGMRRSGRR
jgi:hypothetical protein